MRDIEQRINEINGTMAIEGMALTEADKSRLRDILSGRYGVDTVVKQLVEKHTKETDGSYEYV